MQITIILYKKSEKDVISNRSFSLSAVCCCNIRTINMRYYPKIAQRAILINYNDLSASSRARIVRTFALKFHVVAR